MGGAVQVKQGFLHPLQIGLKGVDKNPGATSRSRSETTIEMPDQRDMKLPSVVSQKPVIAVWKLAGRRWFAHQLLVEAFGGFLL